MKIITKEFIQEMKISFKDFIVKPYLKKIKFNKNEIKKFKKTSAVQDKLFNNWIVTT